MTAIHLAADIGQMCIDTTHPHTLVVTEPGTGTVAYDWESGPDGQRGIVNPRSFTVCGPQGWLFAPDAGGSGAWRFSLDDPVGHSVAHLPTNVAHDGSAQVYARDGAQLWSSPDAGETWSAYPLPESDADDEGFVVASADARILHRLVYDDKTGTETFYASSDEGQLWQATDKGYWYMHPRASIMMPLAGDIAPVTATVVIMDRGVQGQHWGSSVYVTGTGARAEWEHETGTIEFVHAQEGVLQFTQGLEEAWYFSNSAPELSLIAPDRKPTSLPLPFPVPAQPHTNTVSLDVLPFAPANVFLRQEHHLYYSPAGGTIWRELPDAPGGSFLMTPYLPLTFVSVKNGIVYTLSLSEASQKLTTPDRGDRRNRKPILPRNRAQPGMAVS